MTGAGDDKHLGEQSHVSGFNVEVSSTVVQRRPAENAYPLPRAEFDILLQGESVHDDKRYCDLAQAVFWVAMPSLILVIVTADWTKLILSLVGVITLGAITLAAGGFWIVFRSREKRYHVLTSPYSRVKKEIQSCFGRQVESPIPISLQGMFIERTKRGDVEYKSKLRIILRSEATELIEIMTSNWEASEDSVPLQGVKSPLLWQLAGETADWNPGKLDKKVEEQRLLEGLWESIELRQLSVPVGRAFRTWIGLQGSVGDEEVLNRCATKRLGILVLRVRISGEEFRRELVL